MVLIKVSESDLNGLFYLLIYHFLGSQFVARSISRQSCSVVVNVQTECNSIHFDVSFS